MSAAMRARMALDLAALRAATLPMVCALRLFFWWATALWVPVLLLPGERTTESAPFMFLRATATFLHVPRLAWVAPAALLVALWAGALAAFSAFDYLFAHSRRPAARVYVAAVFWVALAASYVLSAPIAYGTWLFVGIALIHLWIVRRVRGATDGGRG